MATAVQSWMTSRTAGAVLPGLVIIALTSGCGSNLTFTGRGGLLAGIGGEPPRFSGESTYIRHDSRSSSEEGLSELDEDRSGSSSNNDDDASDSGGSTSSEGILGTGIRRLIPRFGPRSPLIEPFGELRDGDYDRLPNPNNTWWFVLRGKW